MGRQEVPKELWLGTITRIQHFENTEADIVVKKSDFREMR